MKKSYLRISVTAIILVGSAVMSHANVPPPPVNQNIGIPDTIFSNLTADDCRVCHLDPTITAPQYLPERHHARVGQPIQTPTDIPFPVGTVSGPGSTYECLNCHRVVCDPASPPGECRFQEFTVFRDCLFCHKMSVGQATVHHRSPDALAQNCMACHGSLIDNPGDGHFIPSYQLSTVTPRKGFGLGPDGQGGCRFCHDGTTEIPPTIPVIDTVSGVVVFSNINTHHVAFGVSAGGPIMDQCGWCHTSNFSDPLAIRACEACHGVNSLHGIQVDGDQDGTVTPGEEPPYWGHIGSSTDCMGCHNNIFTSQAASYPASYTTPTIDSIDNNFFTAGGNTNVKLYGKGLINSANGFEVSSIVKMMRRSDGKVVTISPYSISQDAMGFTVGSWVEPGSYSVRAVKNDKMSNASNMVITPDVRIISATCAQDGNRSYYHIDGKNFGDYYYGMGAPGTVSVMTEAGGLDIHAWSASRIDASSRTPCAATVTVQALSGEATVPVPWATADRCMGCHDSMDAQVACNNKKWISHARKGVIDAATAAAVESRLLGGKCSSGNPTKTKDRSKK